MRDQRTSKMKLSDIFEILSGYTFRSAISTTKDGNLYLLQSSDLSDSFFIDHQILPRITYKAPDTDAFVKHGDIVLSSRGLIQASIIRSRKQTILASSSIFILRPQGEDVLSEYVAIYINSIKGQKGFSRFSTGGSIQSITKNDLGNIEIPIPPLEIQKELCKLNINIADQSTFLLRKLEINHNILNEIINFY